MLIEKMHIEFSNSFKILKFNVENLFQVSKKIAFMWGIEKMVK